MVVPFSREPTPAVCSRFPIVLGSSLLGSHSARICANRFVVGARSSALFLKCRHEQTLQIMAAQNFDTLEGLAVAITLGVRHPSRLPTLTPVRSICQVQPSLIRAACDLRDLHGKPFVLLTRLTLRN